MRTLFLILFAYLVYRFLIKPVLLGPPQQQRRPSAQEEMMEMMRRMQRQQQQQQYNSSATATRPKKAKPRQSDEYIDFEELD